MSILVSLAILVLVVVFMLVAFAISVTLASRALRERETEWPANWAGPFEEVRPEVGPEGIVRSEREREAEEAGAQHVA